VTTNEEWTSTFLRWADDGSVAIGFVEYIGEPPTEVWRFDVSAENWSADEVAKQALEFTQELQAGIEFTLSVRRNYISWGADAAAFEVLLMISASVISGLATTAIQEKISQLSRRLSGADQPAEPLKGHSGTWSGDRAPAFSRFVMIRPVQSARPRSGEHCFCAGQGAAGPSTTIRTYVS